MRPLSHRCLVASLHRACDSTIQRFNGLSLLAAGALLFPAIARAQSPLPDMAAVRSSVSGQFVVVNAGQNFPSVAVTNDDFVRLDPALLAVSAERIKKSLWRELGIDPSAPWGGRIFLALHPEAPPDENVAIISSRFAGIWNCRVELPEVVSRTQLTRTLTGAVLLELANRDNPGIRSAEIPAWLTEGLSQQLLAAGAPEMILSPPEQTVNGLLESRINASRRGVDAFAKARAVLQERPALTFEQLSWPDDAQLRGNDGGVYRASAQLFVSGLLSLNDGAKNLRAMIRLLPRCYNWQTAFQSAFAADFPRPVDVEKWWALQAVSFAARDAGPAWTSAVSRGKLDEILSVPVEFRATSNSLPVHAAISLQAVIRNFDFTRQTAIFQARLRDLELAHWQMAPPFAVLTDAYRRTLADYLDGRTAVTPATGGIARRPPAVPSKKAAADAIKKLDALDAQRRAMDTAIKPEIPGGKA
jgi:hypothetical protein